MEFSFNPPPGSRRREDDEPMRLLVLGNFSGTERARVPLAERPVHRVDVDSLDLVLRRMEPRVTIASQALTFQSLDDFHPDRLFTRLDLFQSLHKSGRTPPNPAETDDLGRLLGKRAEPAPEPPTPPATGLDALIRHIVTPHIVKEPSLDARIHLEAVHAAMASEMRGLLHDPAFQALESAWRSVAFLASRLELDDHLQLHLLDVRPEELLADLAAAEGRVAETGLSRVVSGRRGAAETAGWSCIAVLTQFGATAGDLASLAGLGSVALRAGAPLLAGAAPSLTGDGAKHEAWVALRRSEVAASIGLATPRLLLRLPYGRSSDPIESFPFEEALGPPVHEQLLWAPGSLATLFLFAKAFAERGWEMEPGDEREIDDLPACTFIQDGEREMQACAERYMTEHEATALDAAGFIPIISRRDRNAVVVPRFQSIADPPAPLAR